MLRSALKICAATAMFGLVHSTLASSSVKRSAAKRWGKNNRNGLYRVFFNGQSLVTFSLLVAYIRRQPGEELYHIRGPSAAMLRASQGMCLGLAGWAAREVGMRRMLGAQSWQCWRRGDSEVADEPEAQGPVPGADGAMKATGPFAWSRHPLNFWPILMLWLNPRMTSRLLAFNLTATAYLVLGSRHEETRLRAAYGEAYEAYQASDVPFYIPVPRTHGKDFTNSRKLASHGER